MNNDSDSAPTLEATSSTWEEQLAGLERLAAAHADAGVAIVEETLTTTYEEDASLTAPAESVDDESG